MQEGCIKKESTWYDTHGHGIGQYIYTPPQGISRNVFTRKRCICFIMNLEIPRVCLTLEPVVWIQA